MSRAFVKEPEGDAFEVLPKRPISPHPNFVTAVGLAAIEHALSQLDAEHTAAVKAEDKGKIAHSERDLRYWTARRQSAQLVEPPSGNDKVQFGSTVTIERDDGRTQTFCIVGEDEADPAQGTLSHIAPLARALFGKAEGETIETGSTKAEILKIG